MRNLKATSAKVQITGQRRNRWRNLLAGCLALTASVGACAADKLAEGFENPPASARPWVYWFPLDGNITSNGITLDLEAMARVATVKF